MTPLAPDSMKGVACLLSLGSEAYNERTLEKIATWQENERQAIWFVALDALEEVNSRILGLAARPVGHFDSMLSARAWPAAIHFLKASDLAEDPFYQSIRDTLRALYRENVHFQRLVRHQTFRSLHPHLHQIQVRNQRHPMIYELGFYLVDELALLASLRERGILLEIAFHRRSLAADYLSSVGIAIPDIHQMDPRASVPPVPM